MAIVIETWASEYCGYPDFLRVDVETSFLVASFRNSSEPSAVIVQASGTDGHNAFGAGEMYNDSFRHIYAVVRLDDASSSPYRSPHLAGRTLKNTIGQQGLV